MHCIGILHVTLIHCSFVFCYPHLQWSPCLSNIHYTAVPTWYSIYNPFVLCFCGSFTWVRMFLKVLRCLKTVFSPNFAQILPIFSDVPFTYGRKRGLFLLGCLALGCSAGLVSWLGRPLSSGVSFFFKIQSIIPLGSHSLRTQF